MNKIFYICTASIFLTVIHFCCQSEHQPSKSENQKKEVIKIDSSLYQWKDGIILLKWADLMDICFDQVYDDTLMMDVDIPHFGNKLTAIDGQEVIAEGYYIPVDETGDSEIVILSAFPYSQCFFCGQAGVESIIDVLVSEPLPSMKTDTKVRFKGKLKLNDRNFDYLIYILEDAVLYPER